MALSPSKLSNFIFIFMPIMFPLNLSILEDQNYFSFHANYVPFQICQFLGDFFFLFFFSCQLCSLQTCYYLGVQNFFFLFFMPIMFPSNFCHFWGSIFPFHANYVPPFFGDQIFFHANYIPSKWPLFWDPFLFHANYVPFQIVKKILGSNFLVIQIVIPFKTVKIYWDIAIFFNQFLFHAKITSPSKLSNFSGS